MSLRELAERLETTSGMVSAASVILTALMSLTKGGRKVVMKFFRGIRDFVKAPARILAEVRTMSDAVNETRASVNGIDGRVGALERDLRPEGEGGRTMPEMIMTLINARKYDLQAAPLPAFECDANGSYTLVSEAFLKLVGGVDDADLLRLSWMQFIYTEDRALIREFRDAAAMESSWRGVARFRSKDSEELGQWEIWVRPVGPRHGGGSLFTGKLRPVDEVAKALAEKNRWQC